MFIESFTGVTDKMDIQIQKSCEAIVLVTTAGIANNTVLVSCKVVGKNGNRPMYQDVPLLDLAELMSQDEGLYVKDLANYVGNFPFASARSILILPLAIGGAYKLQNEEYFSLDFKTVTAGTTYRVSALESLDDDGTLYGIDKKAVPGPRVNQSWNPAPGAMFVALTRSSLDKIRLFSRNSRGEMKDAEFTFEELACKAMSENDIVAVNTRAIATTPAVNLIDNLYGFDNLLLINLAGVEKYEVFCTGSSGYSFYEVREQ